MSKISKEAVLSVARIVFRKYGLRKGTMHDIASLMGSGKASLYYYFHSKEEVFYASAVRERDELFEKVTAEIARERTISAKLKVFCCVRSHEVQERMNLYPLILLDPAQGTKNLLRKIRAENENLETGMMAQLLSDGIANGEFPRLHLSQCQRLARIGVAILHGLDVHKFTHEPTEGNDILLESAIEICLRGLKSKENIASPLV